MEQQEMKSKMMMLFGMAYEISTQTKADVFIDYYSHVNFISVGYYKNGWEHETEKDYVIPIQPITIELLNEIIKDLQLLHAELLQEERVK